MHALYGHITAELAPGRQPWLTNIIAALIVLTPIGLLGNGLADVFISSAAALFLLRSFIDRDISWAREPWIAVALGLWAYLVVRGFLSVDPERSGLKALTWVRFIVFAAALNAVLAQSVALRLALLYAIIAMAAFGAADALIQFVIGHDIFGRPILDKRLTGPLQNPSIGVLVLFVGLPGIIHLLQTVQASCRAGPLAWRSASVLTLIFATIVLCGERMTMLMLPVILGLIAILILKVSGRTLGGIALVCVASLGLIWTASPQIRARHFSVLTELSSPSQSIYTRTMEAGLQVIRDHPIFGVGIKNYQDHCRQSSPGAGEACNIHPHQVWLHITAETGLIGAAGFLGLFVLALAPAVRLWRLWPESPLLAGATIAVLIRLLPFTPSGNFFSNWRECFFWFLLGTSAAMARIVLKENASLPSKEPIVDQSARSLSV